MAGQNASIESIGILSGLIGCLSIIPQIYKSYTSGSSQDLSTSTFILLYIAYTLAIIYGICINHIAVYLSDSVALILYVILHSTKIYNEREVYMKYYYKIVNNVELQEDSIQLTSVVIHS